MYFVVKNDDAVCFDAHTALSKFNQRPRNDREIEPTKCSCYYKDKIANKSNNSSKLLINCCNNNEAILNNNNEGEMKTVESTVEEKNKSTFTQSSSVVMMLLVNQSDSKGLPDLTPLIDSSLEKLKEIGAANDSTSSKVSSNHMILKTNQTQESNNNNNSDGIFVAVDCDVAELPVKDK